MMGNADDEETFDETLPIPKPRDDKQLTVKSSEHKNPAETRLATPDLHDMQVIVENLGEILDMFTKRGHRDVVKFYLKQARDKLDRIIKKEEQLRQDDAPVKHHHSHDAILSSNADKCNCGAIIDADDGHEIQATPSTNEIEREG